MERRQQVPNGRALTRRWARHPRCVGLARSELRKALADWGLMSVEDEALIVLSELITNAVRHAHASPGREIETRYLREADGVRIEVHDADDRLPAARVPGETGGWGLSVIDALADEWGVDERDGVGKAVWAVVSAPAGDAPWKG
ncbi:ATP-binding protein [Streptomyces sp. NPDC059070]|uniref:ATP-binding protein n=1 Tax=Streptomyces sp. NPDC059070 TaxID=3346713 RepID=UPI0036A94098